MRSRSGRAAGFTLIELMLVVALTGILCAIAIPRMAAVITKAQEGQVKGNLGALRSALAIYYADTEGCFPYDDLQSITIGGKYIRGLPKNRIPFVRGGNPGHPQSAAVCTTTATSCDDQGGWGYQNDPLNTPVNPMYPTPPWGTILVNCIHRDTKGAIWYLFGS